jgi:hypothetical protein
VSVIEAGSLEEAVAINNDVPYGLVSSIYTQCWPGIESGLSRDNSHE